jgi:hypothetical protein
MCTALVNLDKNVVVLNALKNGIHLNYIQNFSFYLTEDVFQIPYKDQTAVYSENYKRHKNTP